MYGSGRNVAAPQAGQVVASLLKAPESHLEGTQKSNGLRSHDVVVVCLPNCFATWVALPPPQHDKFPGGLAWGHARSGRGGQAAVGVVWCLRKYWLALVVGMTRGKIIALIPWMANVLVMILEPMWASKGIKSRWG